MKHLLQIILLSSIILSLLSLASCKKDTDSGDDVVYYASIVTCLMQPDSTVHFEQVLRNDLGSVMLYPDPPIHPNAYDGQRAMLQYFVKSTTPDSNMTIGVLQLSPVRHDTIISAHPDTIAAYPNDRLQLSTGWRTGMYMNLEMRIEFYYQSHRLDLFYHPEQTSPDTLNVILRHDANGDMMGYWTTAYASFYIPELNTYKAMRVYANLANDPMQYVVYDLK